jgi:hypothetical protein
MNKAFYISVHHHPKASRYPIPGIAAPMRQVRTTGEGYPSSLLIITHSSLIWSLLIKINTLQGRDSESPGNHL